ncbi:probable G-protein coupled receptor 148 [Engraulis encrasicolus]|uniref:probable G-protein coupled receptor 148 n=1 Tax=Engraulis encrasicolus TaxID=184585 RepID=UPI002FD353E3
MRIRVQILRLTSSAQDVSTDTAEAAATAQGRLVMMMMMMSSSTLEDAGDFFMSLLCAFGNWYNGSGFAEEHSRLSEGPNASQIQVELFARQWSVFLLPPTTRLLQVCPILGFLAACLVTPLILSRILMDTELRQQTRFLLLANALLSDLLFLSVYMLLTCLNVGGVVMSDYACAAVLLLLGALYMAGILSTKAMVLDTSLAVLAPLRYLALWPPSRTRGALAAIWLASVLFPAAAVGTFLWYYATAAAHCSLHICSLPLVLVLAVSHSWPLQVSTLLTVTGILVLLLLVLSGYLVLCWQTRQAGVWRGERSSRARGTFLIHYLHLFLSFCPMLVLAIELLLTSRQRRPDLRASLWVSLVVCNVLLVLPKALAPYLYGLRYRDLSTALVAVFTPAKRRTSSAVSPET